MALPVMIAAAVAAAASSFNLDCRGVTDTYVPARLEHSTQPYARTYRIDLAARRWCMSDCRQVLDIVEITGTSLILAKRDVDTPREHEVVERTILRQTGEEVGRFTFGAGDDERTTLWRGACEKAPFTGFPQFETKF